ncbi:MAG: helix-turn-helix transcriptional regulator [Anaerolineae bacterium]|nr:helix-turn-helix transcriptional regulator [Anaerolineae bacterium]
MLALLAEGLTQKEIATRLVVSVNTVKRHEGNLYTKLDAHNRVEAIGRARKLDIF